MPSSLRRAAPMSQGVRRLAHLLPLLALCLSIGVHSETYIWIDERGVTHLTDDPEAARAAGGGIRHGEAPLQDLWEGPLGKPGETATARAPGSAGAAEARIERLLRGAVADLDRGESARAAVVLKGILREQPSRPEPHWYLARLSRHRGRYRSAEIHLESFLASAGDHLERWRVAAAQDLEKLADERRLADASRAADPASFAGLVSDHFRIVLDPQLGSSGDYARTVLGFLEQARDEVSTRLGATPVEKMGVVFYGRASYDRAHRERFSFRTVGFFDGRIHVVSAAHPEGELRALLFHEYVHAVFREATGSDRPYWWNEGLAELTERASRNQPGLTRSERSSLVRRIDAKDWIPLRRLAPSFSGLGDDDARAAYLEAAAAALWIEQRTTPEQRGRLLELLGSGRGDDRAFQAVLGLDTQQIDAGVQAWLRSEFRALPAAAD